MRKKEQIQEELKIFRSIGELYKEMRISIDKLMANNRALISQLQDEMIAYFPDEGN